MLCVTNHVPHRRYDNACLEAGTAIQHFLERPPHNDGGYSHPSLEAWRLARAALMDDPDAVLPI
jgi:hypothetical protein